jgi:hypothetical protein
MIVRLCASLIVLGAAAAEGFGQTSASAQSDQTLNGAVTGTLRSISDGDLLIEANDKNVVRIALGVTAKFYRSTSDSGAVNGPKSAAKLSDFQPGDQLNVEYFRVTPSYFRATQITLIKPGTPAERSRALQPLKASPAAAAASNHVRDSNVSDGNTDSSDPRPTLQRQPLGQNSRPNSSPAQAASTPRSVPADEGNPVARAPAAPSIEPSQPIRRAAPRGDTDPVIESAREAAFTFSQTLPNYIVQQHTSRYGTQDARGSRTSWQTIDTVTADVICENGKESYKNILVDGKPPREAVEDSGSWSTGEYISLQLDVLADDTNAGFHNRRSSTIVNRAAYLYDFTVQQPNSHWRVHAYGQEYAPAFDGSIWIDKENSRVLRIEISADNLGRTFPLDTVQSAVDYDYVPIGDGKYLLPERAESISCKRGTGECSRNVTDFRNYRKFTADATITFGPDN